MTLRRSRDELAADVAKMAKLRSENKTVRQIADIMGYKSAGTVSEHLRKGGYFSIVFSELEINELVNCITPKPRNHLRAGILDKLTKTVRGEK